MFLITSFILLSVTCEEGKPNFSGGRVFTAPQTRAQIIARRHWKKISTARANESRGVRRRRSPTSEKRNHKYFSWWAAGARVACPIQPDVRNMTIGRKVSPEATRQINERVCRIFSTIFLWFCRNLRVTKQERSLVTYNEVTWIGKLFLFAQNH